MSSMRNVVGSSRSFVPWNTSSIVWPAYALRSMAGGWKYESTNAVCEFVGLQTKSSPTSWDAGLRSTLAAADPLNAYLRFAVRRP
jgi:hypothetical protein